MTLSSSPETPPPPPLDWFPRTRDLALTLTGWPSVSGSAGEVDFAERLLTLVRSWAYFQRRPEDAWAAPAHPSAASNVFVLVRGRGPQTVVLSGHYDTVGTGPYGDLQPLAQAPDRLTAALVRLLEDQERQAPGLTAAERLALDDLRSGEFLAGRGLLDMKGGLAAGLAVVERYAALPEAARPGNLLLIASPDEEVMSRGARRAAGELPELARHRGLHLTLGLNLDATNDVGDGREGRAAYLGTVGKLLVWTLVVGRPTHAAYPYDGTSAALIASELLREVEGNAALSDRAHGESSPPPVCLEWRDLRAGYDVTTPPAVWAAFNVLTHRRSPAEVLGQFTALAGHAAAQALNRFAQQARAWGSASTPGLSRQRADLLTFEELRARAAARVGQAQVAARLQEQPTSPDPLSDTREVVACLAAWADLQGPAVVLGLGAVHYPHTHVSDTDPSGATTRWVHAELDAFARSSGVTVATRPFFAGISDMSFLGHVPSSADETVARQTPCPAHVDRPVPDALAFPTVNVGPWGRDYHQRLERIHQPYAFGTLPALLWQLLQARLLRPSSLQPALTPGDDR
ncbi:M20/M25/M40 family metallo-hydrolase [Deinococcus petrolearius]|uniref:M20/M25/M40 family metallo-hydrolase n=1 Tax=Deinococcus petrolearius TaxID=1751295 RepID=A0ABW1DMC8_9DEIO